MENPSGKILVRFLIKARARNSREEHVDPSDIGILKLKLPSPRDGWRAAALCLGLLAGSVPGLASS
jgi:hypothetical protein